MRRITLLLSMVGLAIGGATAAIVGCGGEDEVAPTDVPDGAVASSSGETGASSSSSSSGGSTTDPDGSGSTTSSGGAPPTNPGRISCGASDCDAGGGGGFNRFVCCERPNGGIAACTRQNDCDNQGPDSGLSVACDETADCDDNERCCLLQTEQNLPGPGPDQLVSRTACQNRCQVGNGGNLKRVPQVCKTSAECGDAGACAQKDCGGFKVFVCGSPEGCK